MSKLRLDIDSLKVESFAAEHDPGTDGTVFGRDDDTLAADTCHCWSNDVCTGIGVCSGDTNCYTDNPVYYACTGQDPCTGAQGCTRTTCTGYC